MRFVLLLMCSSIMVSSTVLGGVSGEQSSVRESVGLQRSNSFSNIPRQKEKSFTQFGSLRRPKASDFTLELYTHDQEKAQKEVLRQFENAFHKNNDFTYTYLTTNILPALCETKEIQRRHFMKSCGYVSPKEEFEKFKVLLHGKETPSLFHLIKDIQYYRSCVDYNDSNHITDENWSYAIRPLTKRATQNFFTALLFYVRHFQREAFYKDVLQECPNAQYVLKAWPSMPIHETPYLYLKTLAGESLPSVNSDTLKSSHFSLLKKFRNLIKAKRPKTLQVSDQDFIKNLILDASLGEEKGLFNVAYFAEEFLRVSSSQEGVSKEFFQAHLENASASLKGAKYEEGWSNTAQQPKFRDALKDLAAYTQNTYSVLYPNYRYAQKAKPAIARLLPLFQNAFPQEEMLKRIGNSLNNLTYALSPLCQGETKSQSFLLKFTNSSSFLTQENAIIWSGLADLQRGDPLNLCTRAYYFEKFLTFFPEETKNKKLQHTRQAQIFWLILAPDLLADQATHLYTILKETVLKNQTSDIEETDMWMEFYRIMKPTEKIATFEPIWDQTSQRIGDILLYAETLVEYVKENYHEKFEEAVQREKSKYTKRNRSDSGFSLDEDTSGETESIRSHSSRRVTFIETGNARGAFLLNIPPENPDNTSPPSA